MCTQDSAEGLPYTILFLEYKTLDYILWVSKKENTVS